MSISKNIMICGHGKIQLDHLGNIPTFTNERVSVLTFAPPAASCVYSPKALVALRKSLSQVKIGDFDDFREAVLFIEKKITGTNYCSKEWAKRISHITKYNAEDSCTIQSGVIGNKDFQFLVDDPSSPTNEMGVWDLDTGMNILSPEILTKPLFDRLRKLGMELSFSMVIQFIHKLYGNDVELNILDCTCSKVYDIEGKLRNSPTTSTRLNKSMKSIFKTPKNATRTAKSASPTAQKSASPTKEKSASPRKTASHTPEERASPRKTASSRSKKSRRAKKAKNQPTNTESPNEENT
jgi:flagellar biosynthesis GTPase FlhF